MPAPDTKKDFIRKSKEKFGSAFGYSKIVYVDSKTPVVLICKKHGEITVVPGPHLSYGRGCMYCKGIRYHVDDFKKSSNKIHKDKYKYDKVTGIITAKDKVAIECPIHGYFYQTPSKHIGGKQGCPRCNPSYKKDQSHFLSKSEAVHGVGTYDYSEVIYTKSCKNVIIICKKHGRFLQTPNSHLNGHGCNKCCGHISKKESDWLDMLGVLEQDRDKSLKHNERTFRVDAFVKETNTVYEFYGDFWHGNPKTFDPNKINFQTGLKFKEMYNNTKEREKELRKFGYNIVTIWERDFMKILQKEKALLKKQKILDKNKSKRYLWNGK